MARRRKQAEHENHERWLVSYADFITLLFAFFVVMFASSQSDKGKAQQVAESVRKALEEGFLASKVAAVLGGTVNESGPGGPRKTQKVSQRKEPVPPGSPAAGAVVTELLPSLEYLSTELEAEIRSGKVHVSLQPRGLVVSLSQAAFFPSGEDTIDPATYNSIEKVANAIRGLPNPVRLEGHTDSIPIHNARFHSNWELSVSRGIAMLELLTQQFGIPSARLAVAGYADNVPIESNDTGEGRARNRRVDIVILNRTGLLREPLARQLAGEQPPPAAGGG